MTCTLHLFIHTLYTTYCIEIWGSGNITETYLQPLLKIQKKLARILTFSSFQEPSQKLFVKLGWLHIYDLFLFHISLIAHKQLHFKDHVSYRLSKLIKITSIHQHETRSAKKCNLFKHRIQTKRFVRDL